MCFSVYLSITSFYLSITSFYLSIYLSNLFTLIKRVAMVLPYSSYRPRRAADVLRLTAVLYAQTRRPQTA